MPARRGSSESFHRELHKNLPAVPIRERSAVAVHPHVDDFTREIALPDRAFRIVRHAVQDHDQPVPDPVQQANAHGLVARCRVEAGPSSRTLSCPPPDGPAIQASEATILATIRASRCFSMPRILSTLFGDSRKTSLSSVCEGVFRQALPGHLLPFGWREVCPIPDRITIRTLHCLSLLLRCHYSIPPGFGPRAVVERKSRLGVSVRPTVVRRYSWRGIRS